MEAEPEAWLWMGGVEGVAGRPQVAEGRYLLARHHAPLTPPEPGSAGLGFPRVPLGLRCGTECCAGGPAVSSSGAVSCRGDAMLRRTL